MMLQCHPRKLTSLPDSTKKTFFAFNVGAGSTGTADPCEMKFPTEFSDVGIGLVDLLDVVSKYFPQSNCIDKHNHVCQSELALEKHCVTQDPFSGSTPPLLG
jgi:hypothetical protein